MPITAILIPAADCVLLLHQLVIGPVTANRVHHSVPAGFRTGFAGLASQFSLPIKPSGPARLSRNPKN